MMSGGSPKVRLRMNGVDLRRATREDQHPRGLALRALSGSPLAR
jgi:hypothetical protein